MGSSGDSVGVDDNVEKVRKISSFMNYSKRLKALRSYVNHNFQSDKRFAVVEILAFVSVVLFWIFLPIPRTIIPLLLFAWASLWLRSIPWREVGLRRPRSLLHTILIGAMAAVGATIAGYWIILPALASFTNEAPGISSYHFLQGNVIALLILLVMTWPFAAIMEEMVYRGYLLNRLADIFGHTQTAWIVGLIASSLLFSLSHGQYSVRFIATSLLMGILEGVMYLIWDRNLWMPIVIHGVANTIAFGLVFLGVM